MTEENQKRRNFLMEIETIVHETLASQPSDDSDCGRALDKGLVRIAAVVAKYRAEWPGTATFTVQCTGCKRTVPLEQAHRVSGLRPDGTVPQGCAMLCDKCHAALAEPHGVPSWTMSGRHG